MNGLIKPRIRCAVYPVNFNALEVSKAEAERFEEKNNIKPYAPLGNKTNIPSSAAGRPSVMKHIYRRYNERLKNGEIEKTLAGESKYLNTWASSELGRLQVPAIKTIANNLRPYFNARKQAVA